MGDDRRERHDLSEARDAPPPWLADMVEMSVRRIMTTLALVGGLIALAVYMREGDEGPRYQVTAADGRIIRVNTESGTVIACEGGRCSIVLQRGQRLERQLRSPEAQPAPALPAPTAAGNETVPIKAR